jgi:DNA helicase HerA-like ATPase
VTGLRIAEDLELPIDLVVQKVAILARSGAGKTNTAVDVVEELLEAKQQVVVLDPPGAWWGLRTSADGKKPGYPVVVLGGVHGDLPLER